MLIFVYLMFLHILERKSRMIKLNVKFFVAVWEKIMLKRGAAYTHWLIMQEARFNLRGISLVRENQYDFLYLF